ncbi:MAG TPA: methionyl-tRNA formyltransferase [Vitreimonas sp.]|nr:methionyl-tRNA formyltransferase [Vitreimonas sp.]
MIGSPSLSKPSLIFFGSFLEYSALILESLSGHDEFNLVAVVTTPPMPLGRKQVITKTPVHLAAEKAGIPVFTPEKLTSETLAALPPTDLFVTAGYGKLLPVEWLKAPRLAALNLHFSLLPKYRGANPAEWALLLGESTTGVTLIEMSPEFDTGTMVAQTSVAIEPTDTRETVYQKVYELGAKTLPSMVAAYVDFKAGHESLKTSSEITFWLPPIPQPQSPTPYAKRFTREDGFIAWEAWQAAMIGTNISPEHLSPLLQQIAAHVPAVDARWLETTTRALAGFPGVWTRIPTTKGEKRLKILAVRVEGTRLMLEKVQIEGMQPSGWNEIKTLVTNKST